MLTIISVLLPKYWRAVPKNIAIHTTKPVVLEWSSTDHPLKKKSARKWAACSNEFAASWITKYFQGHMYSKEQNSTQQTITRSNLNNLAKCFILSQYPIKQQGIMLHEQIFLPFECWEIKWPNIKGCWYKTVQTRSAKYRTVSCSCKRLLFLYINNLSQDHEKKKSVSLQQNNF